MAQTKTLTQKMPWNDRKGQFSPFKATVLVLVSLPALWLAYRLLSWLRWGKSLLQYRDVLERWVAGR